MLAVMLTQVGRKVHTLVARTKDNKLKKIRTYINNYEENVSEIKRKKEYLNLLRNIYHTIPSRLNEKDVWDEFVNKLKAENCYFKLKQIVQKGTMHCQSLYCRQIIFLYYIGFDDEMSFLLNKMNYKLSRCEENNFIECDKYINEDINDVIKMLYVLYYFQRKDKNYKDMMLLFDKYIYHSKNNFINNLKYLFYFHLFYFNMNYSLVKIERSIYFHRHLLVTEQLMLLIRYVNIYLKYLYLQNAIKHRNDLSYESEAHKDENKLTHTSNLFWKDFVHTESEDVLLRGSNIGSSGIRSGVRSEISSGVRSEIGSEISSGVCSGIRSGVRSEIRSGVRSGVRSGRNSERSGGSRAQREIGTFINNLFRINKNEKKYFIFNSFDDIEIRDQIQKKGRYLDYLNGINKAGNRISSRGGNIDAPPQLLGDSYRSGKDLLEEERNKMDVSENLVVCSLSYDGNIPHKVNFLSDVPDVDKKGEDGSTHHTASNKTGIHKNDLQLNEINDGVNNDVYNVREEEVCRKNRTAWRREEITVSERELKLYKSIYNLCVKEVFKNILLNKERISVDIIWNNFISNLFKDEYIYLLMNEMKNGLNILNEEKFLIYLKQVRLLKLHENSLFIMIANAFFKNYYIEKKYITNLPLADKMTYYTDIFCYNCLLQKYVLYIYKFNFNKFNIKILKKILCKLFYVLKENRSLINGYDKFIKSIIMKIIMNGSLSDNVVVLYILRQYNFYKICMNRQAQSERETLSARHHYDEPVDTNDSINSEQRKEDYGIVYSEIKNKVVRFLSSNGDNCLVGKEAAVEGGGAGISKQNEQRFFKHVDSHVNMFHLSSPLLGHLTKDYLKIYEYMCYRTIIEKRKIHKITYDKYFDINIILMINKQVVKLFCIFINKFFDSVVKGDKDMHIYECINDFFIDNPVYYSSSEKKHMYRGDNSFKGNQPIDDNMKNVDADHTHVKDVSMRGVNTDETEPMERNHMTEKNKNNFHFNFFGLKRYMPLSTISSYIKDNKFEYNTVQNFVDLLLMIIIDNFIYFEINNFFFLRFFFLLFEKDFLLPMNIYHYFFFFYILKNMNYSQISQRERREYTFSEEYFNKNKKKVVNLCSWKIKSIIRGYICENMNDCAISMTDCTFDESDAVKELDRYEESNRRDHPDQPHQPDHPDHVYNIRGGKNVFDLDCLINLIVCHLSNEDIADIFQSCFLFSLNLYLKSKGNNVVIKYWKDMIIKSAHCDNSLNVINCNNFQKIRSLFRFNEKRKERHNNTDSIIRKYEFFYVNIIDEKLVHNDNFDDERDYECYIHFLAERERYEAEDILNVCKMGEKFDNRGNIEIIINNIKSTLNRYSNFEFFVSYLFLLILYDKKNYINDICIIFSEINKYILLMNKNINSFWHILLAQLIYLMKIKKFFSFDLLFWKYKNVADFYNDLINTVKKNGYRQMTNTTTVKENNTFKYSILHFLKKKETSFLTDVHLKDSPFIFDIYVPSANLLFINQNKYLFCDIFVQQLQENIFDHMNSHIFEMHEKNYNSFTQIVMGKV
ncbi:conserved Plasmodium protein, unknown function [Plasmodium malariae]|uniref:Uncharacterized protein n=2 Tax=Plasmodium malariae TaxID=5858 RepID=A0A1D3PAR7_PLAMA|nr:conserved Plasmodium protein, unknown function [Plasmodium malariae]SCN12336.1 conserved Plasmodium protein, unknown function [Plasmodium malariae]